MPCHELTEIHFLSTMTFWPSQGKCTGSELNPGCTFLSPRPTHHNGLSYTNAVGTERHPASICASAGIESVSLDPPSCSTSHLRCSHTIDQSTISMSQTHPACPMIKTGRCLRSARGTSSLFMLHTLSRLDVSACLRTEREGQRGLIRYDI